MPDMRSAMKRAGYGGGSRGGPDHRRGQQPPRGERARMPALPPAYFLVADESPSCLDTAFVSKGNLDAMARYLVSSGVQRQTGAHHRTGAAVLQPLPSD